MNIGIIGTGNMAHKHAEAWTHTPARVAAFLGRNASTAGEIADGFGAKVFERLSDMLEHVDAIDICTPTPFHHAAVMGAAQAGKHIVCEKPLARTLPEAQEMIAACEAHGVKLLAAHVVRFFPEYAQAREAVASGRLGAPAVLRLSRCGYLPTKEKDNWFADFAMSGGVVLDMMIHDFDYALWVAGEAESVYVSVARSPSGRAMADHALVILKHRNGALSHIEGSWAYPAPHFRTQVEIACANGLITFDSASSAPIETLTGQRASEGSDIPTLSSPLAESPLVAQMTAFYNTLANDAPTRIAAQDALAALRVALAALDSAHSGKAIAL